MLIQPYVPTKVYEGLACVAAFNKGLAGLSKAYQGLRRRKEQQGLAKLAKAEQGFAGLSKARQTACQDLARLRRACLGSAVAGTPQQDFARLTRD
eukprot:2682160-Pyramimonas_sp.AAC.1